MIESLLSWPTFLLALVVFGFAPGAVVRVIVLAFHRDDPRRAELIAELYVVPRLERPFWVMQQLEVALVEGAWDRIVWAATGRVIYRWHLESAVARNLAYPETFWIPAEAERMSVGAGSIVQLIFEMSDGYAERMWVHVTGVERRRLVGHLRNEPAFIPRLEPGDKIKFKRDHIMDIKPEHDIGTDVSTRRARSVCAAVAEADRTAAVCPRRPVRNDFMPATHDPGHPHIPEAPDAVHRASPPARRGLHVAPL